MTTLHGTLLQPRSLEQCDVLPHTTVRIGNDGRIASVGQEKNRGADVVGGDGCWLLPGFVDAHLHLSQWDRRGIDGVPAAEWRDKVVYPAELRLRDPAFAEALAEDFTAGLISRGTTTVVAYGSAFSAATDRAFQVFERRGLRAIFGRLLSDGHCPAELCSPADQQLDEARELAAKWHKAGDGRLQYAFSPRNLLTCSEKLLRGAAALADVVKGYLHTHAGESSGELQEIHARYPDSVDDIDLLSDLGLLTERTVLGHGVFINPYERHRVAEARTTLVHTPTADLFLENGLMDLVAFSKAGVRLALGSSLGAGPEAFMPRVAVQALQLARALRVTAVLARPYSAPSATFAWWLLTTGGAEAVGLGEQIGRIQPHHAADCLVVRPEPWLAALPREQQVSALLHTLSPSQIEHVFVAGQRVGPQR